jgi:hypothetical protein
MLTRRRRRSRRMEDAYASDYASFWLTTSSRSYLHDISP